MAEINNIRSMTDDDRAHAIEKAELKRLHIVEMLEEKTAEFARLSGKRKLAKRNAAVGKAPQDWKKKNKL